MKGYIVIIIATLLVLTIMSIHLIYLLLKLPVPFIDRVLFLHFLFTNSVIILAFFLLALSNFLAWFPRFFGTFFVLLYLVSALPGFALVQVYVLVVTIVRGVEKVAYDISGWVLVYELIYYVNTILLIVMFVFLWRF